jgi:hypothetical protein
MRPILPVVGIALCLGFSRGAATAADQPGGRPNVLIGRRTMRQTGIPQQGSHPVVMVSWNDAQAFCDWLSGKERKSCRFSTEAEWEYACRAGTASFWHVGNEARELRRVANIADSSFKQGFPAGAANVPWDDGHPFTAPAGRFEPNAFGVYDMHGNVLEWCHDWYDANYYERSPGQDPKGPNSGKSRVIRGGGWIGTSYACRSACHGTMDPPTLRTQYTGFRVVCEMGKKPQDGKSVAVAEPAETSARTEIVDVRRIWDQAPFNAFTDLIRFRDQWYCVFRESQTYSSDAGSLRVLTSSDGRTWTSSTPMSYPKADLRDPKLSVTPDGRLIRDFPFGRRPDTLRATIPPC